MMRLVLFSLSCLALLNAEVLDEHFLSSEKAQSFSLDQKKVQAEAGKLSMSWINPIQMNYSGSFKEQFGYKQENYSGMVSINQPIFKSGGIWFAINYASAMEHANALGVTMQKRAIIKELVSMMMQLRKLDLSLEKMRLQISDTKATFLENKEQNRAGEVDEAMVNLQEIALNGLEIALLDLENQKESLLQRLALFSSADYTHVELPVLTLIEDKIFQDKSLELAQMGAKRSQTLSYRNMMISKYLPTFSLTASYNYAKGVNQAFSEKFLIGDTESSYSNYGFSLSMMLDVNILNDVQSAQVDYIKAKIDLSEKEKELISFYKSIVKKVANIDKKIALSQKSMQLYAKVLQSTKQGFKLGSESALALLKSENQSAMKALDIKIFEIDKQLELLALYEKTSE